MASRLNPYLNFAGDARQAMEFYRDVFGGELRMMTFGDFGNQHPEMADKIMHALLETELGFALMASDLPPGVEHRPGRNVIVSISGDDGDTLRGYWQKLAAGGTVNVPLEKQAWGDEFGECADRFGILWMVNISQPS